MIYRVSHNTTVQYASPIRLAQLNLRLRPAAWPGETVSDYLLSVDPLPWTRVDQEGAYVVNETRLVVRDAITQLKIASTFTVEVEDSGIDAGSTPSPTVREVRERALKLPDLGKACPASYLFASPMAGADAEIARWGREWLGDDRPALDAGHALMHAINDQFEYDSNATFADTQPGEAFAKKRGVCQDFAHVMIIAARACGIPAAYVSGYLRTLPPPGQPRMVGADAMHAWVALWCGEDLGWVGFDPTNDKLANESHIFIAMGRDYSDVSPLGGVFHGSAQQTMFLSVDVAPVEESENA
ncbi:transglutaminase [Novosphingobium marinum]|uniref:Transglutaminase-like putative cysteine protease n=1 Tax=Novosphingobium marinum TaxID=1514948 RepID=A0A7Y9XWZ1_9SPHN|nr:transglutaminase family protein [Novosphingobium marinum]NYH96134.1 transglutaminase-like putative cysteine protease [Novosphingobium marinum]GGC32751.1 transglutaminase [Novosphingobium marinum]